MLKGKVVEEEQNSAASTPSGDYRGRSASIDMQWDLMQSLASTRHVTEITSGELHGPWAPQEARMLNSLPDKQAGGDETIESLEILAYNDFVAVSSRIRHGPWIGQHTRAREDLATSPSMLLSSSGELIHDTTAYLDDIPDLHIDDITAGESYKRDAHRIGGSQAGSAARQNAQHGEQRRFKWEVNIAAMPATSTRRIISREVHSREVCRASHIQEHTHTCSNEKQL